MFQDGAGHFVALYLPQKNATFWTTTSQPDLTWTNLQSSGLEVTAGGPLTMTLSDVVYAAAFDTNAQGLGVATFREASGRSTTQTFVEAETGQAGFATIHTTPHMVLAWRDGGSVTALNVSDHANGSWGAISAVNGRA